VSLNTNIDRETRADAPLFSLLFIASAASFVPQVRRIKHDSDCAGISVISVLSNLVVATYNFSLLLAAAIDWEGSFLSQQPPDARDWLSHAQFAVVWLGQLVLYVSKLDAPAVEQR
jgi:hypothetical protein